MFTDMLDNPIAAGDVIIYPVGSGSSSAQVEKAVVVDIIPLVEKPGNWLSTGPRSFPPYVREDQQLKPRATEYRPRRRDGRVITEKCYVMRVREHGNPDANLKFLQRNDHVTVITSLV